MTTCQSELTEVNLETDQKKDLIRITILEKVVIPNQTTIQVGDTQKINLSIMIEIDQIEIDQTIGPGQTIALDQILGRTLGLILDIDLMTDHLQLITALNPMTNHHSIILIGIIRKTDQGMTNTESRTISLSIREMMTTTIGLERILDLTTIKIGTTIIPGGIIEEEIRPIATIEVILELQVIEATLEIDPPADLATETSLDAILAIMLEASPETSLETGPETSHGAEKGPLRHTPHWK